MDYLNPVFGQNENNQLEIVILIRITSIRISKRKYQISTGSTSLIATIRAPERPYRRYELVRNGTWYGFLVRNFIWYGTWYGFRYEILFGTVRGTHFGTHFYWYGTWSGIRYENPFRYG